MKHQQAIRPSLFVDFKKIIEDKKLEGKSAELVEEKQLANLAESDGWRVLKAYIEDLQEEVDQVNHSAMQTGASFEDIGRNALVIQLTKSIITKIVRKVEDAKEAADAAESGK